MLSKVTKCRVRCRYLAKLGGLSMTRTLGFQISKFQVMKLDSRDPLDNPSCLNRDPQWPQRFLGNRCRHVGRDV